MSVTIFCLSAYLTLHLQQSTFFAAMKRKNTLRNQTFIGLAGFILILLIFSLAPRTKSRGSNDLPILIMESINKSRLYTYTNEMFGFKMYYPNFFEVDEQEDYQDFFQASLWRFNVHIVQQCYATAHAPRETPQGVAIPQPMLKGESFAQIVEQQPPKDEYEVTCLLSEENPNYLYHARFIRKQQTWFVQALIFPQGYAPVVRRLLNLVDSWQVWE